MKIALIGLPGSGKTTVFNALTEAGADLRSGGRAETRLAVVHVPDPRVDRLAELSASKKKTYAAIEYADLVGLGEGGRQMDDRFLSGVRDADALLLVIRAFPEAPGAPPPVAATLNREGWAQSMPSLPNRAGMAARAACRLGKLPT